MVSRRIKKRNSKGILNNRALLRVIDANYNRAKEGLRVVEDVVRFIIQDDSLTKRSKRYRHDLSSLMLQLPVPYRNLLESREALKDVGRNSYLMDKPQLPKTQDLMLANHKRCQEAMRVLEEFSKIIAPKTSRKFQELRFKLYDLEKVSLSKF